MGLQITPNQFRHGLIPDGYSANARVAVAAARQAREKYFAGRRDEHHPR